MRGTGGVMKLASLQEAFQAYVLRGEAGIETEIIADERFPVSLRLGVYSAAYIGRLVEVLATSFPAVQAALGARLFHQLIGEFVRRHPSRFRSARAYGEELPSWLGSRLHGHRAQGVADLARFEWAIAGAFDAAHESTLVPAQLAGIEPSQWPRLQFTFTPTLRRLSVTSNAVAWWKFASADQPRPTRWRLTCTQEWLVWRRELAVRYRRLSRAETRALDTALAGGPFAQLCEQLQSSHVAAALLHGWFTEGLIIGAAATEQPPTRP
jgi:hypothetical protein